MITTNVLRCCKVITSKFVPKRDGPYSNIRVISPNSYEIAHASKLKDLIARVKLSDLTLCLGKNCGPVEPVVPKRRRGRPPIYIR